MIETILKIWMQYGENNICTITINFLTFQAFLLINAFLFCLMPLFFRWLQLRKARRTVFKELKTEDDIQNSQDLIKDTLFKNARWAKGHFQSFVGLWEETKLSKEGKSSVPVQLKEYLTPDIVIGSVGFQRISEALPGIFVAVGIFGTFYGLVLGLRGLDIEQIDQLQQGIGQLINGLSFAFITSLVGIILSVFFSLSHRFGLERIEKNLHALNNGLEEIFPFQSNEAFVQNYSDVQRSIANSLKHLADDVSGKISYKMGPAFGEAVMVHLVPVLDKMSVMLEQNNEHLKEQQLTMFKKFDKNLNNTNELITNRFSDAQDKQTEIVEKILEKYVDNLNLTFREQIKGLKLVIEDTTNVQTDIKLNIINFNEQLQKQFSSQKELIDKTKRAGEVLGDTIEGFNSVSDHFKSATKDISKAAELMDSSAQKAMIGQEMLNESIKTQMDTMLHTMDDLEGSWSNITGNVKSSIETIHTTVNDIGGRFDETLDSLLDKYDEKVAGILGQFNTSMSDMATKYSSITLMLDKLDQVFDLISKDISKQDIVLKEIRKTASSKLVTDIDKVVSISEKLGTIAEKISSESFKNKSWFDETLNNMNSSGEAFEIRNRNIVDEFSKLTDGIVSKLNTSFSHFQSDSQLFLTLDEFNHNIKTLSEKIKGRDLDIVDPIIMLNENITYLTKQLNGNGANGIEGEGKEKLAKQMAAIEHQINYISTDLSENLLKVLGRISQSSDLMAEHIKVVANKKPDALNGGKNQNGFQGKPQKQMHSYNLSPNKNQPLSPLQGKSQDSMQNKPLSVIPVQNKDLSQQNPQSPSHAHISSQIQKQPQPPSQVQIYNQNELQKPKQKSIFRRFMNR